MNWYLRACPVCGGDLHDDLEDRCWATCFLCARSFPVGERANRRPTCNGTQLRQPRAAEPAGRPGVRTRPEAEAA